LTLLITERIISVMRSEPPPALPIFRSDAQARLLTELYVGDHSPRSVSLVAGDADVPLPSAHRELARLVEAGLVAERRVGRQRLVWANESSPLHDPLRELLERAFGAPRILTESLAQVPGIALAAVYGSYAARRAGEHGPPPADIDLLVVGDVAAEDVYAAVERAEGSVSEPINPTILTREEWAADTGFTRQVRRRPLLVLIGELP
jgi:predicted nucleotidyltransferase